MSAHLTLKPVRTDSEILEVSAVAHETWRQHYAPILSSEQIEYMLETIQSPRPIKEQIASGYEYYLARSGLATIGYVAIKPNDPPPELFLSKLYLLEKERGHGYARAILQQVEEMGRRARQKSIWLTVNRHNPSIAIYERLGFEKTREQTTDIGHGFVMDDYIMSRPIAEAGN